MSLGSYPPRSEDIRSRLLQDRIVMLGPTLDAEIASTVAGQLLRLEASRSGKDIGLYINCAGGRIEPALGAYDVMRSIDSDVCTLCTGQATGTAAMLLAAGSPGKRMSLAHARIVLQQPSSGPIEGRAAQLAVLAQEFLRGRDRLIEVLSRHCGRHREQVEGELERDRHMTPEQAVARGVIDGIAERK